MPAESSNRLSHRNKRRRISIFLSVCKWCLYFVFAWFSMGLHRFRNHFRAIRIRVPAAMPAESSKRLSHRNMRKRIFIFRLFLSGVFEHFGTSKTSFLSFTVQLPELLCSRKL
jgi:hypothetical protein